jgi:hypothetical protein
MKIPEIRELLDRLEANGVQDGLRLCTRLDPKLVETLRKDYIVVLEESVWGKEIVLTEKSSHS